MLYTERAGMRTPVEKSYKMNITTYSLLLKTCEKYKDNLIHIFPLTCHDNFTNQEYISFDKETFDKKIAIKIPELFRNNNQISTPTNNTEYDQYALLDLIEYLGTNIKDINKYWNNHQYRNYQIIDCLKTSDIFYEFQSEINEIFTDVGLLFRLTDKKIIERIVENTPLTPEIENNIDGIKELGIKELLKEAIKLYKTPKNSARKNAVEKIWDAFERLKTYYSNMDKKSSTKEIINNISRENHEFFDLFDNEFTKLTKIGNDFRIRHHETDRIEIPDSRYYDYFFNRCLSLIALVIQFLK